MLPPAPHPHEAEEIAWGMLWEQPSQATYDAWYAQAMALRLNGHWTEESLSYWASRALPALTKD